MTIALPVYGGWRASESVDGGKGGRKGNPLQSEICSNGMQEEYYCPDMRIFDGQLNFILRNVSFINENVLNSWLTTPFIGFFGCS